jgi:hypothetical protein
MATVAVQELGRRCRSTNKLLHNMGERYWRERCANQHEQYGGRVEVSG